MTKATHAPVARHAPDGDPRPRGRRHAFSLAALLFGLTHGVGAAIFLLTTYYDLLLWPASSMKCALAVIAIVGLVPAVVGVANLAWLDVAW